MRHLRGVNVCGELQLNLVFEKLEENAWRGPGLPPTVVTTSLN
jgi:hypothetical protein